MSNNHYEKWFFKIPIGFLLIAGGIFFMYYTLTLPQSGEYWILFGLASAITIGIGAVILSSAAVNKMKSDLIKKQKIKQMEG